MKYLFYIHSAITELVSFHTICELKIPKNEVIFLTNRNYTPNIRTFRRVDFIYNAYESYLRGSKNLPKSWLRYFKFKKYINSVVGRNEYYAFVPSTYPDFISLLIYNKKCRGYSIIEEGSFAYLSNEDVNKVYDFKKSFIWDRLGFWGTMRDSMFYNDDYDLVIGFSSSSFPNYPRRKILKRDSEVDFLTCDLKDNAAIIVLSAESIHGEIPTSCYINALKVFINDHLIKEKDVNLYYKLHPSQIGMQEEQIFDAFFQQESLPFFSKLPNGISLEFLAQQKSEMTFYVSDSSVALYARLFGKPVCSFVDYLIESYPPYSEDVKKMPPVLLNNVKRFSPTGKSKAELKLTRRSINTKNEWR